MKYLKTYKIFEDINSTILLEYQDEINDVFLTLEDNGYLIDLWSSDDSWTDCYIKIEKKEFGFHPFSLSDIYDDVKFGINYIEKLTGLKNTKINLDIKFGDRESFSSIDELSGYNNPNVLSIMVYF